MNPFDLLYTNKFVDTNELEFNRNDEKLTRDRINVLKTIDRPFPKRYNRNYEPIISNEVRDIVKNRYKKYRETALCLDSRDRNCEIYENPNNYKLILGKQFNYIESIRLLNVDMGNLPITDTQISWMFPFNDGGNFSVEIPCGIYSAKELSKIMSEYMSTQIDTDGNIQNIFVDINPSLNEIKIINRLQIPEIVALQTILDNDGDIFNQIPVDGYQQNGIYILVKETFSNMELPLIPTQIPNIGGFSNILFNCKEFWNGNFLGNEYLFIDSININGTTYNRYFLIPRIDGMEYITKTNQNIITSASISRFLTIGTRNNFIGTYDNKNIDCLPIIGEARDFAIDFNNSSLMKIFGWQECDTEFKYVVSNTSDLNISKDKCFNIYKCCCDYMFKIEPYILLKLSVPSYAEDTIAGNIIKSQNLPRKILCECNEFDDVINIFAKIDITRFGTKFETVVLKFYETPLEKLDEIIVTFLDREGCIINLKCDNTIVLEIIETVDVLKDTLIDSRHGEANITGIK
jgi:hypothetical protein